jgi:hypothetical protein
MDRREILNELQQIVAITDTVGSDYGIPEVARRAKSLIQVVESWPIAFPPATFVSDQCAERHHCKCQTEHECHCSCHDRCGRGPEAPQQPAEPALPTVPKPFAAWRKEQEAAYEPGSDASAASGPAARHIDTPDELLELLAGVSSDPQVEGLSLAQKASTMALLHIAKTLPQISYQLEDIDTALEQIGIPIDNGAKTLEQLAEMQRTAMDYLMDKSVAATAPQPMRIYVKRSRRRAAEACTSARAAEANEMARKIVAEIEVVSPEDEAEKTVRIALMLRRWRYGDDAKESPTSPQKPS